MLRPHQLGRATDETTDEGLKGFHTPVHWSTREIASRSRDRISTLKKRWRRGAVGAAAVERGRAYLTRVKR